MKVTLYEKTEFALTQADRNFSTFDFLENNKELKELPRTVFDNFIGVSSVLNQTAGMICFVNDAELVYKTVNE